MINFKEKSILTLMLNLSSIGYLVYIQDGMDEMTNGTIDVYFHNELFYDIQNMDISITILITQFTSSKCKSLLSATT